LVLHRNKTKTKKDDKIEDIMADFNLDFLDDFNVNDPMGLNNTNLSSTFSGYTPDPNTDYSNYFDDNFNLNEDNFSNQFNTDFLDDLDFSDILNFNFVDKPDFKFEGKPETGYFGGTLGPTLKNLFLGNEDEVGILSRLIGGGSKSEDGSSGIAGFAQNMLDNDLIKILLGKKLLDDDRENGGGYVPIGQEAYGGGGGQPNYQIPNLQPALLPGMAYANQPTTFNNTPPGMEAGGLMAIPQGNKGLPNLPQSVRNKMGYMQAGGIASLENMMDGPGDITQAMLEPGEFVMTRKATENLTPEFLYDLMHQAENAGKMR